MKRQVAIAFSSLIILLLGLLLWALWTITARTQGPTIVWSPYLSQMTDTSVIIQWTTDSGVNPEIHYSTDLTFDQATAGDSRPLAPLNTQLHRVLLNGLAPGGAYYYKPLVGGAELLPDQYFSFTTAPPSESPDPITFIAFGDYGAGSSAQARLRDRMNFDIFDLILTTGDNAYSDGAYDEFDQKVFQVYDAILPIAPFYPSPGNHDYHTAVAAPYLDIFDLPTNAWRTGDAERYYSFDYGSAHFIALDTEKPFDEDDNAATDDMFDWLRADLAATDKAWRIVYFHDAAYTSGTNHGEKSKVKTVLVPIFEANGVNLVLNGHEHIYQRSHPLLGGAISTIEAGGIVYIVTGAGAKASYPCAADNRFPVSFCATDISLYSRVTVDSDSMLIEAIDHNGLIKDSYLIGVQQQPPPTPTPLPPTPTPAGMSTLEVRVSTGADDGEEKPNGEVILTSSDLELTEDGSVKQTVGMRFIDVTLPPGSIILNTYLEFEADETSDSLTNLIISAEATDNSPPLAACSGCFGISGRPRTSASIPWLTLPPWATDTKYTTPDLSPLIQEIVNRAGWASGNALTIIITGDGYRVAESADGEPQNAPLLHLEYTTGQPTATPSPTSTPTPIPTDTPVPIPTDTPTSIPADTPTPIPTSTAAVCPTLPPLPTYTPVPTNSYFNLTINKNGQPILAETCILYRENMQGNNIIIDCD